MTPKIEWCNWVFDYMDTNKWMVKRDCCDDEILLVRGDSRNWKAYQASLKPYRVGSYPDAASMFVVWVFQISEQEVQNKNTEARCKTVGGEMGYSKCYKNGKEI